MINTMLSRIICIFAAFAFLMSQTARGETALRKTPKRPPCSLNGDLNGDGVCICDTPWSGKECSTLDFEPVEFPQGYGMKPNMTTWGGKALYDGDLYHLFVVTITNRCPLRRWTTNSRVEHAVSDKITGPYTFKDIAINTQAHNPHPMKLPDGTYAIFHIGDGSGSPNGGTDCTEGSNLNITSIDRRQVQEKTGSTIHVSSSLNGPWRPLKANTLGKCGNPSPFVHQNGTIFLVCNSRYLKRAESISGPWTDVTTIYMRKDPVAPLGHYEDANLYIDERGFHVLWHVYNLTEHLPLGHECVDSTTSGYGYSEDGYTWYMSPVQPYGTQILLSSGETITVATRERPKLFFNEKGQMTHLFNAVCGSPNCPEGPKGGCVNCKYHHWDYTLVSPFKMDVL